VDVRTFTTVVRRGFVEKVICTLADWQKFGTHIKQYQPVFEVTMTDDPATLPYPDGLSGGVVHRGDLIIRSLQEEFPGVNFSWDPTY
jgi:hypothetical protein